MASKLPAGVCLREAAAGDLPGLLRLYLHLHEVALPQDGERLRGAWARILADEGHHILVCEADGELVASCVCVVVPNLTRDARPYALIENVVTHALWRRRGLASACIERAIEIASAQNCYKVMLMTGAKDEGTLAFYRGCGFDAGEKTAFVRRLQAK